MQGGLFGAYNQLVWQSIPLVMAASGFYLMRRAGLFAIPQAGLLAVGAYTGGLLSIHHPTNTVVYLIAGAAAGTVVGGVLGLALARLDGIQLAIATVAFNAIVGLYVNNSQYMGGADGLTGIPLYTPDWVILLSFVVLLLLLARLRFTQVGLAMDAMRGSAPLAGTTGINVAAYRVGVFAGCGLICGIAGSLLAGYVGFIDPSVFSFDGEVQILSMAVLGGMMFVIGPAVGALVVVGGPQVFTSLNQYSEVFQGGLIILTIGLFPEGLAGIPGRIRDVIARRNRAGPFASPPQSLATQAVLKVPAAQAQVETAATMPGGANGAGPPGRSSTDSQAVLRVEGIAKQFGGLKALSSINLHLDRAEILGIIGPNGSGKTTFLNIISGVLQPTAGHMWIDGRDVTRRFGSPSRLARAGLARTFQAVQLLPDLSVLQNVCLGGYTGQSWLASFGEIFFLGPAARRKQALRAQAREMLESAGLGDIARRSPSTLPYGHQRTVEVIRALIREPRVLLLDEPSAGMTAVEKADLMGLLETHRTSELSVIIVEHDIGLMTQHCDRLVVLDFGHVIASGLPGDVMSTEEVLSAYVGPSTAGQ